MTHNLGKLDRIFRFILGVLWLSPMAPQFNAEWLNIIVFVIALIALIESFVGFCWLHKIANIDNQNQ
ncbi:MAG: DUF2892 domain-containing protein [Candidatus Pacebacteria bacterium]|nr:DUF2892 domain-containing protein [Candidatus Paceibacterota bacterium]